MSGHEPSPYEYNRVSYNDLEADHIPETKPLQSQKNAASTETKSQGISPVLRVISMLACAVVLSSNVTLYSIQTADPNLGLGKPYWFAIPPCAIIFIGELAELFLSALYKAAGQAHYIGTNRHLSSEFVHIVGSLCAVGGVGYILGDHIRQNSEKAGSIKSIGAEVLIVCFSFIILLCSVTLFTFGIKDRLQTRRAKRNPRIITTQA